MPISCSRCWMRLSLTLDRHRCPPEIRPDYLYIFLSLLRASRPATKKARKMMKQILAMVAAVPAIPPKPSTPAVNATRRKSRVQLSMGREVSWFSLRATRSADEAVQTQYARDHSTRKKPDGFVSRSPRDGEGYV